MLSQSFLLLVATSFVVQVISERLYLTYIITPDDHPSTNSSNTITLSQCLSDSEICFNSYTQLLFLPELYELQEDFIVQNLNDMHITGNHSTIKCVNSSIGIIIMNVTNIVLRGFDIIHCSKSYSNLLAQTFYILTNDIPRLHWNAALHIHNCANVVVINVSITVSIGTDGLLAYNTMMVSSWTDIQVTVTPPNSHNSHISTTNGMVVYYHYLYQLACDHSNITLYIVNFTYKQTTCSNDEIQNVFYIAKGNRTGIAVLISNSEFKDLCNARVLFYYTYRNYAELLSHNRVDYMHCNIENVTASASMQLFIALVHDGILHFYNSTFHNNTNITSFIIIEKSSLVNFDNVLTLTILNCKLSYNHALNIIKQSYKARRQWLQYITILFTNTIISSNTHRNGDSLISLNTGVVKCDNIQIMNNSYYKSVIQISLSSMHLLDSLTIINNHVRNVFYTMEYSYTITDMCLNCVIMIAQNTVYSVLAKELAKMYSTKQTKQLCYFQPHDKLLHITLSNYKIKMVNNIYTAPIHLLDHETYFTNCEWMNTNDITPSKFFTKFLNITAISIDKGNIGIIPSSICTCTNSFEYECISHDVSQTFPGQTFTINLIVPRLTRSVTVMVETANLPSNGCIVTRATEITQAHSNTGCNQYNYTVWSDKTECELYLSAEGMPEIFYVKLLPCPVGFSLQGHLQGCHCDTVLDCDVISVTTCNLADGTILRPANSWISADTVNGSHKYHVSSQCPFDYCLPYSTYLNLFTPDMHCQFNRSGLLCGHCQEGLSVVFGSSQCKMCSNIYLFIIIPIAIVGIALVMMLFVLKLTVTNGTISTFIFYVNIVNTNYSNLLPNCHSPICILLSISNLDLGVETCFYNDMSGYSKTCLQLAFPFYLIMIALALIMGSRYSSKVQRLTARRGLHVLATLFLLSYTKILSMVCHVLFFYTQITHLPSRHTQLFWSVDTSVELFGGRFTIVFVISLIVFVILVSFNVLLLFTRSLLRFKFVNTFKPLLDPYLGPYKDKYFYWTGMQLLLRSIFFSLSALDNKISLITGTIAVGILHCMQGILHPFKSRFNNVQESLFLLNLLLVYIFASYNGWKETNSTVVEYLILVVLVYFIIFIIYTCIITILQNNTVLQLRRLIGMHVKVQKGWKRNNNKVEEVSMNYRRNEIPDVTFNYKEFREPLVVVTD